MIGTTTALIAGSLISGVVGASGSKKAAETQASAAAEAGRMMSDAAQIASAQQISGIDQSAGAQTDAANSAMRFGIGGLRNSSASMSAADLEASGLMVDAYGRVLSQNDAALGQQSDLYNPYIQSGNAARGAYDFELGIGARPDDYAGFEASPGFQYSLDTSNQAIEGSAAGNGGLFSGATLEALQENSIGLAQQDYGAHLNRLSGVSGQGLSASNALAGDISANRDIYGMGTMGIGATLSDSSRTQGQIDANMIGGTAGMRADNAMMTGNITSQAALARANASSTASLAGAQAQANALGQAANATAAGQVGVSNAWQTGIGNALSGYGYMQGSNAGQPQQPQQPQQQSSFWSNWW